MLPPDVEGSCDAPFDEDVKAVRPDRRRRERKHGNEDTVYICEDSPEAWEEEGSYGVSKMQRGSASSIHGFRNGK